ncbi:hypothetical protein N657DRAFT_657997 [Parathielavia appendiculata]|uniref:Uncharacterized protein n=1 Tax=Parathielavia appendiculata TaxID=2587402 RepID=A0AAN6TUL5_9PEZI|nr:hypothetical protein N657DRAFT_657997 [Parathielavia appendiculata]
MFSSLTSYASAPASGKTHKHSSSSHGSRHGTTAGHSRGTKTKPQRPAVQETIATSFLFVVNEFQVDYEPLPGQDRPLTDQWLNTMPPQQAEAYTGEFPGTVFRYQNGVVSPAHGYLCVYKNTNPSAPHSRGLSGHLPIILALMGFHGRPRWPSDVFRDRKWHHRRWLGSNRASSYLPKSGESPRGLFVQVCADNLADGRPDSEETNIPMDIWEEMLQDLEYRTILVQG